MVNLEEEMLSLAKGIRIDRVTMDIFAPYRKPLPCYVIILAEDPELQQKQYLTLELLKRLSVRAL